MKPRGDIARLSVAVILDDEHTATTDAQGKVTHKSAPRNPAELQKIQQIVAAAVGYDQTRGDLLTVENIAFDETIVEVVEPGFIERYGTDMKNTGKWLGVFLMCAMVLMFVHPPDHPRHAEVAAGREATPELARRARACRASCRARSRKSKARSKRSSTPPWRRGWPIARCPCCSAAC